MEFGLTLVIKKLSISIKQINNIEQIKFKKKIAEFGNRVNITRANLLLK